MKTLVILALALAIPAATLTQVQAPQTCDGVEAPAPLLDVVIEQDPTRYAGPYCAPGETCETPAGWDDRGFFPDGTARHEFTYVGELRAVERNGAWESDELVMAPTGKPPACWAWQWRPVAP